MRKDKDDATCRGPNPTWDRQHEALKSFPSEPARDRAGLQAHGSTRQARCNRRVIRDPTRKILVRDRWRVGMFLPLI